MKISILTPTYNRANTLKKLYTSLKINSKYDINIEWIIIDDGSNDNTEELVANLKKEATFPIIYRKQQKQGKMTALNNIIREATGDFIVECDSDDYFTEDAMKLIRENCIIDDDIYAYAFLKYDQDGNNMGNSLKTGNKTTMFDLYFKQGETGEKALVFNSKIRKEYKYELEHGEKFVTEARMYHKMDKKYKICCINEQIMICEYRKDGYSKNIKEIFIKNPYGYFEYFKEILQMSMKNVPFSKRLYVYKHYILFSYLTHKKRCNKGSRGL